MISLKLQNVNEVALGAQLHGPGVIKYGLVLILNINLQNGRGSGRSQELKFFEKTNLKRNFLNRK